jgi:hypothetical protein
MFLLILRRSWYIFYVVPSGATYVTGHLPCSSFYIMVFPSVASAEHLETLKCPGREHYVLY